MSIYFKIHHTRKKMEIQKITTPTFEKYGKIIEDYCFCDLLKGMEKTPLPEDVIYVASDEELEALPVAKELQERGFGGLPIQIGYCNGNNKKLNAVEYHRNSEIVVAVTDIILLLGLQQDVTKKMTYETSKIEGFLVPAGTGVELYATTLHYAPCNVAEEGFKSIVVLPKDTNTPLTFDKGEGAEDKLLMAKNKWLIGHKEANISGATNGLIGANISL
jgi:hypothetical protein